MSVAYMARSQSVKVLKMGLSIFRRGFNSSKCKTYAKMATARIKLLRNKRQVVVKQMRRDVALLLESGQEATARIRVEHVIREQNMMAANEIIELFCEHIVAKLSIISKQRDCPTDLKEGICSLIFAGPRCSDIPELLSIRDIFQKKYGKDFISAATDLRPESGVNRQLIEKLSAKHPSGQLKLKVMKEISKEYQVNWDATETEEEFLKPSQDRIQGPCNFVSASNLPVVESSRVTTQDPVVPKSVTTTRSSHDQTEQGSGLNFQDVASEQGSGLHFRDVASSHDQTEQGRGLHFQDVASAAEAAARSAKDAIAAAQAAAQLANRSSTSTTPLEYFRPPPNNFRPHNTSTGDNGHGQLPLQRREINESSQNSSTRSTDVLGGGGRRWDEERDSYNIWPPRKESFGRFDNVLGGGNEGDDEEGRVDIKFDESDCDEEIEMEPKVFSNSSDTFNKRSSGTLDDLASRRMSHPKLPDYDALAARFESLRYQRSQY